MYEWNLYEICFSQGNYGEFKLHGIKSCITTMFFFSLNLIKKDKYISG